MDPSDVTCEELEIEGDQNTAKCFIDHGFCDYIYNWDRPQEGLDFVNGLLGVYDVEDFLELS